MTHKPYRIRLSLVNRRKTAKSVIILNEFYEPVALIIIINCELCIELGINMLFEELSLRFFLVSFVCHDFWVGIHEGLPSLISFPIKVDVVEKDP